MEILRGTRSHDLETTAFQRALANYAYVLVDLGTGDGRFVQHTARAYTAWYVIGIDACRENLRAASRNAPVNAQYVIANALVLPHALHGVATHVTINFPWGSLLQGLLNAQLGLLAQIAALAQQQATLEIRLNAGALAEAGWELGAAGKQICSGLAAHGFRLERHVALDAQSLRACPTTWAKRLGFGRDPRAIYLRALRCGE